MDRKYRYSVRIYVLISWLQMSLFRCFQVALKFNEKKTRQLAHMAKQHFFYHSRHTTRQLKVTKISFDILLTHKNEMKNYFPTHTIPTGCTVRISLISLGIDLAHKESHAELVRWRVARARSQM